MVDTQNGNKSGDDGHEVTAPALLGGHHCHELFVIDLSVTVNVGFTDHLVDFLVCEFLAEVCHDVPELGSADESVAVLVKHAECFTNLLLTVCVLHLPRHHCQELGEVDCAIAISIHLIDHVLELSLCGVLSQGPHDGAQLLGGDGAIAILVEQGESLLEFSDLFSTPIALSYVLA